MGTKNDPGEFDCYSNAEPDEPMFVLLGRDRSAPTLVRAWARERERLIKLGEKPPEDLKMVEEAMECAVQMESFHYLRNKRI
jgi:cob(I)alamin adenosyltransferase